MRQSIGWLLIVTSMVLLPLAFVPIFLGRGMLGLGITGLGIFCLFLGGALTLFGLSAKNHHELTIDLRLADPVVGSHDSVFWQDVIAILKQHEVENVRRGIFSLNDTNTWFLVLNGQQAGPFTIDQLRGMAAAGTLQPGTLVWAEGMAGWAPANTTPLPQAMSAAVAPPPPPPAAFAVPPAQAAAQPAAPTYTPHPVGAAPAGGGAAPPRSFVEAIQVCLAKYVDFKGRASRSEFWWFVLFQGIVSIAIHFLAPAIGMAASLAASNLFGLACLLPTISCGARRLHDTNRTGWLQMFLLLPSMFFIVLLIANFFVNLVVADWFVILILFCSFTFIIVLIVFLCQKGTPGPNRFG
jgi:uncharacterized membrane protein YhaH (DUF805 family)